jgi:hypothetical protein
MSPLPHRRIFLKRAALAAVAGAAARPLTAFAAPRKDAAIDVGLEPRLFLDDHLVESSRGLDLKLHRPRKAGLILEADGRPWELGDQISVVRDLQGRFHMTYRFFWWDPAVRDLHPSIGEDKAHWFRETHGYAVSDDGRRWSKPVLGLAEGPTGFARAPEAKWKDGVFVEPKGMSRENNLGWDVYSVQDLATFAGATDPRRRYLVNVLRKAGDHPFAEVERSGLYFARNAPDPTDPRWREGLETIWEGKQRGARGPSVRVAGFDAESGEWFECAQSPFGEWRRRGGRDIGRWTSRDLQSWTAAGVVLPVAADESKEPSDWIEYMDIRVFRAGGAWLGQLVVYHGDRSDPQSEMPTAAGVWRKGTTEMRLVVSRDAGKSWKRVGGKEAWIPHHEADDGFDRLILTASPVRAGDELWLYYSSWDGDHLTWRKDGATYYRDRMRIARTALAVLRWDGFASLRGGERAGEVTTKPLVTTGRRLAVNAAAGGGAVRVEVQDAAGKPLPGYTLDDSTKAAGDGLAQPVSWRGRSELPPTGAERPFRLRFEVAQADLYGFAFLRD